MMSRLWKRAPCVTQALITMRKRLIVLVGLCALGLTACDDPLDDVAPDDNPAPVAIVDVDDGAFDTETL